MRHVYCFSETQTQEKRTHSFPDSIIHTNITLTNYKILYIIIIIM